VKDNNDDMTTKGRNFFSTSGNPSLKLSNRQVERLRRDRGKGVLLRKLAQKYGVRESTVSRIANGVRRAT
jgi:DNA-binding Xre family transcriptional regulator